MPVPFYASFLREPSSTKSSASGLPVPTALDLANNALKCLHSKPAFLDDPAASLSHPMRRSRRAVRRWFSVAFPVPLVPLSIHLLAFPSRRRQGPAAPITPAPLILRLLRGLSRRAPRRLSSTSITVARSPALVAVLRRRMPEAAPTPIHMLCGIPALSPSASPPTPPVLPPSTPVLVVNTHLIVLAVLSVTRTPTLVVIMIVAVLLLLPFVGRTPHAHRTGTTILGERSLVAATGILPAILPSNTVFIRSPRMALATSLAMRALRAILACMTILISPLTLTLTTSGSILLLRLLWRLGLFFLPQRAATPTSAPASTARHAIEYVLLVCLRACNGIHMHLDLCP